MKYFAFILSFIVLALSANPCIDKPKDNTTQNSEISQSTNNNNHQNDTDHCSPFCTCQCCQTNFYVSNITSLAPSNELGISYIDYSQSFQSLELFDFYIPPKS
jgi:hypothetical protein